MPNTAAGRPGLTGECLVSMAEIRDTLVAGGVLALDAVHRADGCHMRVGSQNSRIQASLPRSESPKRTM